MFDHTLLVGDRYGFCMSRGLGRCYGYGPRMMGGYGGYGMMGGYSYSRNPQQYRSSGKPIDLTEAKAMMNDRYGYYGFGYGGMFMGIIFLIIFKEDLLAEAT